MKATFHSLTLFFLLSPVATFLFAGRGAYKANEEIYPEGSPIFAENWRQIIVKSVIVPGPVPPKTAWTNEKGRTLTGDFIRLTEGKIVLKIKGKDYLFPLSVLTEADQRAARLLAATENPNESPLILKVTGYGNYGDAELILGSSLREKFLSLAKDKGYTGSASSLSLPGTLLDATTFRQNIDLKGIVTFSVEQIDSNKTSLLIRETGKAKTPTQALSRQAVDFLNMFANNKLLESVGGKFISADILLVDDKRIKLVTPTGKQIFLTLNQLHPRHMDYINAISVGYRVHPPRLYFCDGNFAHFSFFRCLIPLERKLFADDIPVKEANHLMSIYRSAYLNNVPSYSDEKGSARVYGVNDEDPEIPIHRKFLDPPPHGGVIFFPGMRKEKRKDFLSYDQYRGTTGSFQFDVTINDHTGKVLQTFNYLNLNGSSMKNKFDPSLGMLVPLRLEKSLRKPQTVKLVHTRNVYVKVGSEIVSKPVKREFQFQLINTRNYRKPKKGGQPYQYY